MAKAAKTTSPETQAQAAPENLVPAHLAPESKDVGHELVDAPASPEKVVEQSVENAATIELLAENAKLKDVIHKLNEVIEAFGKMTAATKLATRDRGPDSTRDMVEDDARRILLGDLKDLNHKEAANKLGLSYGQVYSSRKGFTFKNVFKEWRDAEAAKASEAAGKRG